MRDKQGVSQNPFQVTHASKSDADASTFHLAVTMAILSVLAFEAALFDEYRSTTSTATAIVTELAAILGLGAIVRCLASRFDLFKESSRRDPTLVLVVSFAAAPFAIELLVRSVSSHLMLPLELLLLIAFRNIVIATALFAHRPTYQQVCCSLSLFLVIFATSISTNRLMAIFLVLFAMTGIGWLVTFNQHLAPSTRVATAQQRRGTRWGIGWLLALTPLVLAMPIAVAQPQALSGFIPSSGGSHAYNQLSRSGVGDGDDLIAGTDQIQSFAPIEDAPFMSSHEPSLYDLYDDTYSEPVKIEKQERSIALSEAPKSTPGEAHPVDTQKAGKEFSTLRKADRSNEEKIAPHSSDALFFVKGRLPIHLKMEVFDRYDGINWYPEDAPTSHDPFVMETAGGKPWLRLPLSPALDFYASPESYALKIVHLDTNRIPSPTQLLGIHIDKLDQTDFYRWAQPGIIRMDREKVPSGIVMNVRSRVVDERLVEEGRVLITAGPKSYRETGEIDSDGRIKSLALEWTDGVTDGWPQVRAIVRHLRTEYRLERDVRPPADCENTAIDFLFNRRSGSDYEFATAAVLMLRSLGISTRLASGFYVDDSRFDARAQYSPVAHSTLHFWAEVHAGKDHWIPIEPTPGYELLLPPPTIVESVMSILLTAFHWMISNISLLIAITTTASIVYYMRLDLTDNIETAIWRLWPGTSQRERTQRASRLLINRCRRVHNSIPAFTTQARWLQEILRPADAMERFGRSQFVRMAEWAAYAPTDAPPPLMHVHQTCERVISTWTLTRLRRELQRSEPRTSHLSRRVPFFKVWTSRAARQS